MSMKKLNNEQQAAVKYIDGPLLIVAGAGTGKTMVITEKIAYLVNKKGVKPEEILALTFTDKAAAEMQERVDLKMDIGYAEMQISTFHTFCQRLLEDHGLDIGLPHRFKLLTQTDAWLMMREEIYNLELDYYRPLGNPSQHIHALLNHFSKCKDELISPEEYLQYAENVVLDKDDANMEEKSRLKEVANAYHTYNQLLRDNAALDFGDLIYFAVKLLQKRPAISKALSHRYKYILVDEFQDVNYAQYELVKAMSNESQLTVVGDDDQSIYAFRGASVSNILRFKDDFPKAKDVVLTHNYRSGQKILDAAYTLIQENNPDRLEEKLGIDKSLLASGDIEIGLVHHIHPAHIDDEAVVVAELMAKLKKEEDLSWDDMAILVRANNHAEPFIHALEAMGIPYEFLTSAGLHRQPIVLDCFSFFRVVANTYDSLGVYRLLRMACIGLDEHDVHTLSIQAKKKSLPYIEALKSIASFEVSDETKQAVEKLTGLIKQAIAAAKNEKPTTVLLQFLEECGYLKYLTQEIDAGDAEMIRQSHYLKQFFEFVEKYQQTVPDAHVQGFMEYYNQVLEAGDDGTLYQPEDTPESVNIMTVHGSKGLEFDTVFVINCVEERFPTRRRRDPIELPVELTKEKDTPEDYHYQEERRLFYVAMTRAKRRLYLTSADNYGGVRKKKVSRFVNELKLDTPSTDENKTTTKDQKTPHDQIFFHAKHDMPASKLNYTLPKTFSFSQIRTFENCPYQYKLFYILKIPMPGSPYFSFGNSIHLTLQRFYERVQELNGSTQQSLFDTAPAASPSDTDDIQAPSLDELLKIYEEAWIADWYESYKQRKGYYKKGKEMLRTFYKEHDGNWSVPVALEGGFKIKLDKYIVTGKIDRIDQEVDGNLHIIDYKTGKAKEKVLGKDKDQLLLYQLAAQRLPEYRHLGDVSKLTFYYLSESMMTSFHGKDKDLDKFENKIVKTLDKLHATDFSAITKQDACGRCIVCTMSEFRG